MSGGYVGVDVFFVISGYLITGIIARELGQNTFSLAEFYRRRARRIFPALTAVAVTSLVIGYLILTPSEYSDLGKSAAAMAAFSSNFFFWKSVSYWTPGIEPLLHTWSLAVEEQYYVLFPLFLMLTHGHRKVMIVGLWTVFFASFILSVVLVNWKPQAAFYLLPARAWELMLGGLLALGVFGESSSERSGRIASVIGLLLIFVPFLFYTSSTPFPGTAAVPPVIGASLVIWGKGWGLSARPLVAIGLLSYSLYLWHLPVIDFMKYLTDDALSAFGILVAIMVSVLLSVATYFYIETPFRKREKKEVKTMLAAVTMPATAIIGLAIFLADGVPQRLTPLQTKQLAVVDDELRHPSKCMSIGDRWIEPSEACRFGPRPNTLLWGDSHAMVTATSLNAAGVSFFFAADADCPIGINLSVSSEFETGLVSQGHYRRCGEYNRKMLVRALDPDIETVVLSSRWTNWRIGEPANPAEKSVDIRLVDELGTSVTAAQNRVKFERAFTTLVAKLTNAGKHVVIVGPLPEPTFNVPHRLYVEGLGFAPTERAGAEYESRHRTILAFFRSFNNLPNVSFIWPSEALCTNGCAVARNDIPLYFDHNHLTFDEATRLSPLYRPLASPH